jgi:hypothetical protein
MKKCVAFAVLASIWMPGVASAGGDGGGSVNVGGFAPPVCSFRSAPRQLSATNMGLTGAGPQGAEIIITQLIDESTARLKAASIQIEILGVCNAPHYITLMTNHGGLAPEEQASIPNTAFARHVNYRAEALWAGQSVALQTDATPGKKSPANLISGANNGALNLKLTIDGATNDMTLPTANGVYSDALIIQIGSPL